MAAEFAFGDLALLRIGDSYINSGIIGVGDYNIHLFKNNYHPVPHVVPADLTEATFGGYAAQGFDPTGFSEGIQVDDAVFTMPDLYTWTPTTTGGGQTVYGYWVSDEGDNVAWVVRWATPVVVAVGIPINLIVRLRTRACPDQ